MERKIRQYEADGIVVEYEIPRCIHAEECVHGLPAVFDPEARPWIRPENASADEVAAVVRRCPTGALRYRRTDGGAREAPPTANRVRIAPDGPLYLTGRVRLHLPDGEVIEETRMALCRCGESRHKPFCDNTHLDSGFEDAGLAADPRLGPVSEEADGTLTVRLSANGPILIEGPVEIVAANERAAAGGKGALCRCGASGNKPFCDGTHKQTGFEAD